MEDDLKFVGEECESEKDTIGGEIKREIVEQSRIIQKLSITIPRLEERLKVILCVGVEHSIDKTTNPISTELGKELQINNEKLSIIFDKIVSIIDRLEL